MTLLEDLRVWNFWRVGRKCFALRLGMWDGGFAMGMNVVWKEGIVEVYTLGSGSVEVRLW